MEADLMKKVVFYMFLSMTCFSVLGIDPLASHTNLLTDNFWDEMIGNNTDLRVFLREPQYNNALDELLKQYTTIFSPKPFAINSPRPFLQTISMQKLQEWNTAIDTLTSYIHKNMMSFNQFKSAIDIYKKANTNINENIVKLQQLVVQDIQHWENGRELIDAIRSAVTTMRSSRNALNPLLPANYHNAFGPKLVGYLDVLDTLLGYIVDSVTYEFYTFWYLKKPKQISTTQPAMQFSQIMDQGAKKIQQIIMGLPLQPDETNPFKKEPLPSVMEDIDAIFDQIDTLKTLRNAAKLEELTLGIEKLKSALASAVQRAAMDDKTRATINGLAQEFYTLMDQALAQFISRFVMR